MTLLEIPRTSDGARRAYPPVEWLRSPARPALQVASALDGVRRAPTILPAMRTVPALLSVVDDTLLQGVSDQAVLEPLLEAIDDGDDTVASIAAVHALARVPGHAANVELLELILEGAPGFEDHALWAIAARPPATELIRPVARAVARGSLPGMHAQRTLSRWAASDPLAVLVALESTLLEHHTPTARRFLVETVGLVPGRPARQTLERVALDDDEHIDVRATAVSAFVERAEERLPTSIGALGHSHELADVVRETKAQRQLRRRGIRADASRIGMTIAQLHLGETGGLATLLPQLGAMLADRPRISEVVTIVRGDAGARSAETQGVSGQRIERIALTSGDGTSFTRGWPGVVAIARGIRSALLASSRPDILHLRMADPASLAGSAVARELGIPVVFTLAADPHGPIESSEAAGSLDRRTFAGVDARDGLWFRADLVERLARQAREVVLFPRPDVARRIHQLTGIDLASGPPRTTVVAEGVDTTRIDTAEETVREAGHMPAVLADLQAAISRLPVERHGLPILLTVGRLHEVKGMARLVEAFCSTAALSDRANLVIVGGNLDAPSSTEAAELARIQRALDTQPGARERVVLLGQRHHEEVALVMAATGQGWGSIIADGGAYVSASAKEEFGLAIVEAMAAGLPTVAPVSGGPATYIDDGVTGVLVDTTNASALASAALTALDLARTPGTAERSRTSVRERYTLHRMARDLSAVYRIAAGATTLRQPVHEGNEAAS